MITDLFILLGLCFACGLFWQQRRQSELARVAINQRCQQLELQLVSVAFGAHHLKTPDGRWIWHTTYQFEFSALGDDCYQAQLTMQGFRMAHFQIPPYRM